jgi:PLD-like domain
VPNRIVKSYSRSSTVELADVLASLFSLELLSPSPVLYIISPWLSDMPILDNQYGQFRAVIGDYGRESLGLAAVLTLLAERGTQVRVMTRGGHLQTDEFLRKLPLEVEQKRIATLHEKGLVSHHYYLRGSMNFTFSGVNINDESVELTTDSEDVTLALKLAEQRWESISQ